MAENEGRVLRSRSRSQTPTVMSRRINSAEKSLSSTEEISPGSDSVFVSPASVRLVVTKSVVMKQTSIQKATTSERASLKVGTTNGTRYSELRRKGGSNQGQQSSSTRTSKILSYYKSFGDWWNVFPKTDYTYSPSSEWYGKEVAPGIPVRPNMSRKSIHGSGCGSHTSFRTARSSAFSSAGSEGELDGARWRWFGRDSAASAGWDGERYERKRGIKLFSGLDLDNSLEAHDVVEGAAKAEGRRGLLAWCVTTILTVWTTVVTVVTGRQTGGHVYKSVSYASDASESSWLWRMLYRAGLRAHLADVWLLCTLRSVLFGSDGRRMVDPSRGRSIARTLLFLPLILFAVYAALWWLRGLVAPPLSVPAPLKPWFAFLAAPLVTLCHMLAALLLLVQSGVSFIICTIWSAVMAALTGAAAALTAAAGLRLATNSLQVFAERESFTAGSLRAGPTVLPAITTHEAENYKAVVDSVLASDQLRQLIGEAVEGRQTLTADALEGMVGRVIHEETLTRKEELKRELAGLEGHVAAVQTSLRRKISVLEGQLSVQGAQMRRCCKAGLSEGAVERIVGRVVAGLLGMDAAEEPAQMRAHVGRALESLLVTRRELESTIANLTGHYDRAIKETSASTAEVVLGEVLERVGDEMIRRLEAARQDGWGSEGSLRLAVAEGGGEWSGDRLESAVTWGELRDYVNRTILSVLTLYDADKTGMVDYALESSGGSVISTRCTEDVFPTATLRWFGINWWPLTYGPRTVIQPGITPGECWSFAGSRGFLVLSLSIPVRVTAFSVEHIPRSLVPHGRIDSAPKDFSVWGLESENGENSTKLGQFRFEENSTSLQHFKAEPTTEPFSMVELKIESNHGNLMYTCLYRFRVHGVPHK